MSSQYIAWSTRSRNNGVIVRWSRWHRAKTLKRGDLTLCGKTLPFEKWITSTERDRPRDWRIQGGECAECRRIAKAEGSSK